MLENKFQEIFKSNISSDSLHSERTGEFCRSLPISIINSRSEANIKTKLEILPRSWTDKSFYLNQDDINIYVLKYSQLSRSEQFLDLLVSSARTTDLGNKLKKNSSTGSLSSLFSLVSTENLRKVCEEEPVFQNFSNEALSVKFEKKHEINEDKSQNKCFDNGTNMIMNEPIMNMNEHFQSEVEASRCDNIFDLIGKPEIFEPVKNNSFEDEINFDIDFMEQNSFDEKKQALNESSVSDSSFLSTTLNDSNCSSIDSSCSVNSSSALVNVVRNTPDILNETLLRDMSSPDDTALSGSEEDFGIRAFKPKKSCLKKFIKELNECDNSLLESNVNATSSPLTSPRSANSSFQWSTATASEATSSSNNQSSISINSDPRGKKRVSFADGCGKELFTVRTMSEPSNCPPKLTSKIVQYFLNREFNSASSAPENLTSTYFTNDYITNCLQNRDPFFSTSRNYQYSISAMNYTNDVNQLKGSIAVYSLNFSQPSSNYYRFRKQLEESCVSLENVLLKGFDINGTIKVKNINFEKYVFLRCSFDKWKTYEDFPASYVSYDYYSSSSCLINSPASSSVSAAFYGIGSQSHYEPKHKEYDTFRFGFMLPKQAGPQMNFKDTSAREKKATGSIQFCVCFKSGSGQAAREYWDSNGGNNYEILQYDIDLERLKHLHNSPTSSNKYQKKNMKNFYKYESNYNSNSSGSNTYPTSALAQEVYY